MSQCAICAIWKPDLFWFESYSQGKSFCPRSQHQRQGYDISSPNICPGSLKNYHIDLELDQMLSLIMVVMVLLKRTHFYFPSGCNNITFWSSSKSKVKVITRSCSDNFSPWILLKSFTRHIQIEVCDKPTNEVLIAAKLYCWHRQT